MTPPPLTSDSLLTNEQQQQQHEHHDGLHLKYQRHHYHPMPWMYAAVVVPERKQAEFTTKQNWNISRTRTQMATMSLVTGQMAELIIQMENNQQVNDEGINGVEQVM